MIRRGLSSGRSSWIRRAAVGSAAVVVITVGIASQALASYSTARHVVTVLPPERFIGYWTAYGDSVGQLQSRQTYGWGPSWDDSDDGIGSIRPDYRSIDVRAASIRIAEQVHARGGNYAYKPLLDDRSIAPSPAWFASYYNKVLLPVVTGDPKSEPDLIVLETELDGAIGSAYDKAWRTLIADLRTAGYRGKLLGTSSNRYIAGWWDAVDYVGGDMYPAIDTSSLAAATQSWESQVGWQVHAYHAGANKPVLFGELGSYQGSMTDLQWGFYLDGLFAAMDRHPSWAGALFWAGWGSFDAAKAEPQSSTAPPVPAASALAAAAARWLIPTTVVPEP